VKIVAPKYIFKSGEILQNKALLFGEKIEKIDSLESLKRDFPDVEEVEIRPNSLLMAGLINSHIHLEYSHHTTEYDYGSFMGWLNSVVRNFPTLTQSISEEKMRESLKLALKSGTTTVGAISSLGLDLDVLKDSPIRKVVFNEIIASQPHQVDSFYQLFLSRLERSEELKDRKFSPAIAIHSPYSVHKIVSKKVVELAVEKNYPLSLHILESKAERDWLDSESGEFRDFYLKQYGVARRVSQIDEVLELLQKKRSLLVHGVYLNCDELKEISKAGHTVIHSPISNRLLGGDRLDLEKLEEKKIDWALATDGLSSNYSLNLFEEMKIALFLHNRRDLESFATQLLLSATETPADILGLNSGRVEVGKDSDLILIDLEDWEFDRVEKIALHTVLKGGNVYRSYIFGEEVEI
jgi:cytosine/adenosine deaminase-related metal-dependent hydrolase